MLHGKALTPEQRIKKAQKYIEEARKIPRPKLPWLGALQLHRSGQRHAQKAFELIKLIQHSPQHRSRDQAPGKGDHRFLTRDRKGDS